MSMSYSEGVAIGLISADAHIAGRRASAASWDNRKLQQENEELRKENQKLRETLEACKKANGNWRGQYDELMRERNELVPSSSAGLILSDGFVKALQLLPESYASMVKKQVVEHAQGRFKVLDEEKLKRRSMGQKTAPTIEEMLRAKHDYVSLGFK